MKAKLLPPNNELDLLFRIDPSSPSGLVWKSSETKAGSDNGTGHFQVKIGKSKYLTSRIIYQLANNVVLQASEIVDHIDGNPLNNDSSNLRIATKQQNCRNTIKKSGKSKYRGVSFSASRKTKKWMATIRIGTKLKYPGRFVTEEEAAKAYDEAARKIDSVFYNTNF